MENKEALATVEERLKSTKDRRMYERLQSIRLRLMGMPVSEIATILYRSEKTIRIYLHAYEKEGISGLIMRFSSGRSSRLTKEQRDELKRVIANQVPADVGFTARFNWTLQLIADYIERTYGYKYSLRGVSKLMEHMDMSYTKPTYTLAAADPEKQQQFVEETFTALKKG
jgi:transposase